jgi:SPP1 gp7 family putative phage head morphogenesis protein
MGHSETTIAEVRQLFDFHRHGGPSQEKADLEIVRHLSEGTEIGKALRDQIRMEEGLREYWESTGRHVQKEKEKQQERSDLEYKWKNGMGNTDAYSSIEDQWEVEHAYKFKPLGDKLYYRKGGLDKDVVSTSENSSGAKSHSVSGSTSVQPHFKPTNKFTAKEMHAAGYRVLGGFGFNQMGYSGEAEVTWVKIPKLSTNERWRFNTTPEQLEAFKEWLKTQVEYYVTGMTDEELWNKFIESGFKKGAGRAFDDTKPQAGWTEAEGAFYAGTKDQFLKSAFGQPESLSKIQLLAARTFDELEGMSADMQNKLGRILVDGLTRGNGPIAIAREMSNQLNLSMTRAETIARTELIRAHAEGQLVGLEELGVDEVGVMVEWSTAGDDRVCELCEPMEGVVLKIEEARGMIPRHCNCRCAFIPANVAEPTDDQKRGKRKIMSAVRTSAALGKDDFSTAVPVTKERPKSVLPVIANVFDPDEPRDDSGKWTTGESLVGDKGELIKTDGGRIDVQHVTKFSPRKQSVIDFVVDEDKRGKGIGDKLLKQALSKYNDLGGQVSSIASLKVFHNNGFRNPDLPNGSFNEHLKLFKEEGGSLYMAHKDDNGKAYITTNLYVTTIPAPTVVYQFSQLLAGARK